MLRKVPSRGRFWLYAGCLAIGLFGAGLAIYLSVKSSSRMETVHWLPHGIIKWADHHGRFCNFPAYALLALPFMAVCSGLRNRLRVSLVLILLVASMEVVQLGIPTRHSDLWDVFWGGAGIFAVQAVFELSSRWKFRQRDG
jgi:hypothetical protein